VAPGVPGVGAVRHLRHVLGLPQPPRARPAAARPTSTGRGIWPSGPG
jgi:hypothetical protein